MAIATVNPATGETLRTFDELTAQELEDRLARAATAFARYRLTSFDERAGWLRAAADLLDAEADDVGALMTTEMGKPLAAAVAEVHKCATGSRFFADHAPAYLADEEVDAGTVKAVRAFGRYQPLGPVLAVMPWNFPLWQAMRFAAPALMAGNVGLLKHSSNVPQTALYIADVLRRAGFPADVFQTLLISSGTVERVLRDPRVAAATVTGSAAAGAAVAAICGDVHKKTVLELGGSDPFVILPSADVATAVTVGIVARYQNNGQSCIAAKRFIAHRDVAEEFERRFVAAVERLVVGDPMEATTDIGPLALEQGVTDLEEQLADAVERGATVLTGGHRVDRPGWFFAPTVVSGVTPDMRMYHEEVFGPVAAVYRVDDLDEAVALANATDFGLGANVWTQDEAEQERCIRDLAAGAVFVNGMTTSYPQLPFGGIKQSGYGRELSAAGIREFCNLKTVWVGDGSNSATATMAHSE